MMILNTVSPPILLIQFEQQIMKAMCHLSHTGHPRVECGINGKVMQRLEKEASVERGKEDWTGGSDRRGHTWGELITGRGKQKTERDLWSKEGKDSLGSYIVCGHVLKEQRSLWQTKWKRHGTIMWLYPSKAWVQFEKQARGARFEYQSTKKTLPSMANGHTKHLKVNKKGNIGPLPKTSGAGNRTMWIF